MASKNPAKHSYTTCAGIKRPTENKNFCKNNELLNNLAQDYNVCPLFERRIAELSAQERCSLQTNKFLACRWREYKEIAATRLREPFKFPHVSDFHFYNCYARYKPSESITYRTNNRLSLIPEPGIDAFGIIPIPNDIYNFRPNKETAQKAAIAPVLKKKLKKM